MLRSASVDRRFFQATADALASMGLGLPALCAAQGIEDPLAQPGERVPLAAVTRVFLAAARASGRADFIYLQPEQAAHESSSVFFQLVVCCGTPAEMARTICRYSSLASDAVRFELEDDTHRLSIRVVPNEREAVSPHQVELAVWFLVLWARRLRAAFGVGLDGRVSYTHAALFDEGRYREIYGMPVAFGAPRCTVEWRGDALHRELPGHDLRRLSYLRLQAERYEGAVLAQGELPRRVAVLIAQRLAFGLPDAASIAAQLNLSVRSLQRRLQQEGSSWSAVADQARHAVALRELELSDRPLAEIAMLTGFSDTRAFLRAFRRWTGQTPSAYRRAGGRPG